GGAIKRSDPLIRRGKEKPARGGLFGWCVWWAPGGAPGQELALTGGMVMPPPTDWAAFCRAWARTAVELPPVQLAFCSASRTAWATAVGLAFGWEARIAAVRTEATPAAALGLSWK